MNAETKEKQASPEKRKPSYVNNGEKNQENNRMGKTRDRSKNIRDIKGTFHAKVGTIKDRNGMDLKKQNYYGHQFKMYINTESL